MASTGDQEPADAAECPLILDGKEELLFFRSAAHLEAYVEAIDVVNGEYGSCWDAQGRLHRLAVEKRRSSVLGVIPYDREIVRVQAVEDTPTHMSDLHLALLRHLELVGLAEEMPITNDTPDILEFALEHAGWT